MDAMRRNLRDIRDGHLTLIVTVAHYNPATGEPLPEPTVMSVHADRAPAVGTPDRDGDWWTPLIDAGYLRLPPASVYPQRYLLSEAGEKALADADSKEQKP